jgi:hypothetical protein
LKSGVPTFSLKLTQPHNWKSGVPTFSLKLTQPHDLKSVLPRMWAELTQPPHMIHVLLFPPTFHPHFHPLKLLQSGCVIYRWNRLGLLYAMVVSELQNSYLDLSIPYLLAILL